MRRKLFTLAVLGAVGLTAALVRAQGPAPKLPVDFGPGDQGATLKQPWLETSSTPKAVPRSSPGNSGQVPDYLQNLLRDAGVPAAPGATGPSTSLQPSRDLEINKDIEVTKALGPWMILVSSYSGTNAPHMARDLAMELRNTYKIPAYVFNYGAEEKRKELQRVTAIIEKQKEMLRQANLPLDQPIRVRHMRVDDHCGVLIGGYRDDEAAKRALVQLRKLTPPDPTKVKMDAKLAYKPDPKDPSKALEAHNILISPFDRAFVVRNPTEKVERKSEWDLLDLDGLKRMNSEEPYSLLKCTKPWTLVIKQFSLSTVVTSAEDKGGGGLLDRFGFGGKKDDDRIDGAALNAHNLVETLRKGKVEAYVLHTKFYSLVTIGGFDSMQDPAMRSMSQVIMTQIKPKIEVHPALQLFPEPRPMIVPGREAAVVSSR